MIKTDIEIYRNVDLLPINKVAESIGLTQEDLELFGKYKAKIDFSTMRRVSEYEEGKLILVTSINPTPAGEGKSTVTIDLGDALNHIGKKTIISLREPLLDLLWASKVERLAEDMFKYCRWKISTCISLELTII